MPSAIMLSVTFFIVMLNVIMLSVVMPSVVAPAWYLVVSRYRDKLKVTEVNWNLEPTSSEQK